MTGSGFGPLGWPFQPNDPANSLTTWAAAMVFPTPTGPSRRRIRFSPLMTPRAAASAVVSVGPLRRTSIALEGTPSRRILRARSTLEICDQSASFMCPVDCVCTRHSFLDFSCGGQAIPVFREVRDGVTSVLVLLAQPPAPPRANLLVRVAEPQ